LARCESKAKSFDQKTTDQNGQDPQQPDSIVGGAVETVRLLDIAPEESDDEAGASQQSYAIEKKGKDISKRRRQRMEKLKEDDDTERNDESVENEEMHRPGVKFPENATVTEHLGDGTTKTGWESIVAIFILAGSP
jgi:repressor of nif and glnA expression